LPPRKLNARDGELRFAGRIRVLYKEILLAVGRAVVRIEGNKIRATDTQGFPIIFFDAISLSS
jgi:hypothetical protein